MVLQKREGGGKIHQRGLRGPASNRLDKVLIMALDRSSSMAAGDKMTIAWESVRNELLPRLADWHLGILLFPGEERNPVSWLLAPTTKAELVAQQCPLPLGSTPMLQALRESWGWLRVRAIGGRILLVTDGVPDNDPEEIIAEAVEHGVPIDCIGVGTGTRYEYDAVFLRRLSEATGGIFKEAGQAWQVSEALKALSPAERKALGAPK